MRLCEGVACAQTRVRFLRPIGQPITGIGGQTRGDNGRDSADKVVCALLRVRTGLGWHPESRYHQRHVGPKRNAQDIRAENRMGGCRGAAHRELGRCRRIAIGISSVVGVRWTRAQLPAAPRRGEDAPRTLGRQKTSEKDKPRAGAASPGREAGETWNVFWGRSLSTKSSSATPVGGNGADGCSTRRGRGR